MNKDFDKVKSFLIDLEYDIVTENAEDGVVVISKESEGINNLVVGCSYPILIMEQYIFKLKSDSMDVFKSLLMKNRDIIHGAFVIDEEGDKVLFRDTIQIENLDKNELEGSINSLSLLLNEFSDELISYSKN